MHEFEILKKSDVIKMSDRELILSKEIYGNNLDEVCCEIHERNIFTSKLPEVNENTVKVIPTDGQPIKKPGRGRKKKV